MLVIAKFETLKMRWGSFQGGTTTTMKPFLEKLVNASWLTSFDRLVHLRMLMSGGLINIKTCCIGLERTHLIWDAEYMVRPELAAPASPLWPQCLRGRMIVWSGKELFVIARLTRSTVDTVSLQTIGETRSAQWLLSSTHIFPMKTFAEKWRCKISHCCWLTFWEKDVLL